MRILKDIPELVEADIISQETAERISDYYKGRSGQSENKLLIVFGVLGAILLGLGIILIIAHNWDELSKASKTCFAFFPLIAGQLLCIYTLFKKQENIAWRESATAFLFFAIGASISLVSQIYNIPGDLGAFMLTWMLLCLPLMYIMKSSVTSLLYIIGITFYAEVAPSGTYFYWLLFFACLPHYYMLYKEKPKSNFMIFHNWLVPISVTITLGTVAKNTEEIILVAYISLFGLFYLIGNTAFYKQQRPGNNGYLIIGSLGTVVLLLALSFDLFWKNIREEKYRLNDVISSPEFIACVIISLLASVMLYMQKKNQPVNVIKPIEPVFILFIFTFIIGLSSSISVVLTNLLVFIIGVLTLKEGAKQDHLGILNYGLIIITALVICRFFDTDLSFVIRGIVFMAVGVGFFMANFMMYKKRKDNA